MINYVLSKPEVLYAADIETTGLLEDLKRQENPRLHNFGLKREDGHEILFTQGWNTLVEAACEDIRPITELQAFLDTGPGLIMHNGMCYDLEALIFFGYDVSKILLIDTLYLAWYLEPLRNRYGLEEYGEEFGIKKPAIADWQNLSQEEYNRRVMQDCRIQLTLWKRLWASLSRLYEGVEADAWRALNHVCVIKARHLRSMQRTRWKLDVEGAEALEKELEEVLEERRTALIEVMPQMPKYATRKRPAKVWKISGGLSNHGIRWLNFCLLYGVDFESKAEYSEVVGYEPGNPGSPQQLKAWLFDLGWVPETFNFTRTDTGEERAIPQICIPKSGGLLDPGIEKLAEENPAVAKLAGYGLVKHRYGIVKGWLRDHVDGYLTARAAGFTNTLRLRHGGIQNVPSARVPYGEGLRALLTVEHPDNEELLGADLSSLEDRCKHHYQIPYDPEYVKTQMTPGYDPHMRIARMGGLCKEEDEAFYVAAECGEVDLNIKENKDRVKQLKPIRNKGKPINYGCQYGQKPPGISRASGMPLELAERLYEAYWALNWSILEIAKSLEVKSCLGVKWLYNPVAKMWYHLKAEKDRFSTLCQGTGAFAFDMWLEQCFLICEERWNREPALCGQFHDELIFKTKKSDQARETWKWIVGEEAIRRARVILNMRREIDCDVQFGQVYSAIH